MNYLILILFSVFMEDILCQETILKFLFLKDDGQEYVIEWFEDVLKSLESSKLKFDKIVETVEDEEDIDKICNAFADGATFVIDASWSKNEFIKNIADDVGVPFISVDISISPILKVLEKYMDYKNSSDVAYVFDDKINVDQALYYLMGTTRLRLFITENLDEVSGERLKNLRPTPSSFAIVASTMNTKNLLTFVQKNELIRFPERINLALLDFEHQNFNRDILGNTSMSLVTLDQQMCCSLLNLESCNCPDDFNLQKQILTYTMEMIAKIMDGILSENSELNLVAQCNDTKYDERVAKRFYESFWNYIENSKSLYNDTGVLRVKVLGSIETGSNEGAKKVAYYTQQKGLVIVDKQTIAPIKPFYRIGTTHAIPWSYQEKDPKTGKLYWTGYCIDFAQKLSELMGFDYEIVAPKKGGFGKKRNGVWDGVVGDLVTGGNWTGERKEIISNLANVSLLIQSFFRATLREGRIV